MPISDTLVNHLFEIARDHQFPKVHERLAQIGVDNLAKYMTVERYHKVKNGMLYNDSSKSFKSLALIPNREPIEEPATNNQAYAIFRIGLQWFMPQAIQKLVQEKDLEKLTKRQASTVIDRLKMIERDIDMADDDLEAYDNLDEAVVIKILEQLPKTETIS